MGIKNQFKMPCSSFSQLLTHPEKTCCSHKVPKNPWNVKTFANFP